MTRESKAGLLMIVMLAGVFGFMVYKRTHRPAAAMAQQNTPPESPDSSDGGSESSEPKDPFLTAEDTSSQVIPAAATAPAPLSVDNQASRVTSNDNGGETSNSGPIDDADPFGTIQTAAPASKPRLPTSIGDEIMPRTPTALPSLAGSRASSSATSTAGRPVAAVADKAPESDSSSFDPFSTDVQQTPSQPVPVRSADPDVKADADPFDEPARIAPAATNLGSQPTPVAAREVSSQPKSGGADDPFASTSQSSSDGFEVPIPARRTSVDSSGSPRQKSTGSDPFDTRDDLEVQRPASSTQTPPGIFPPADGARFASNPATESGPATKTGTVPENSSSDAAFEAPNASPPAAVLDSNIEDAFDQVPVRSDVPALKIPSRDAAPATDVPATQATDDKFGGFRPANPSDSTARAFAGDEHPSEPTIAGESVPRRAIRPAPVTQIDEDFGSTASSRPLVAGDTYLIEPGDNFWSISRKKYGTGRYFMALAQHNLQVIPDPRRMRPGVSVATPPAAALERAYPQLVPKAAAADPIQMASTTTAAFPSRATAVRGTDISDAEAGFFIANDGAPMYRVGQEDTLGGISQRYLGRSSRWVQILELNRDVLIDGNTLKIGAVLRLPADASRVEVVDRARILR